LPDPTTGAAMTRAGNDLTLEFTSIYGACEPSRTGRRSVLVRRIRSRVFGWRKTNWGRAARFGAAAKRIWAKHFRKIDQAPISLSVFPLADVWIISW